ncbi:MAG TPA: hypothetical protein VHP56_13380 [Solirubrobacterales bacterium]|nr:hypothetical protein [Solirubrobacterales bacterium]
MKRLYRGGRIFFVLFTGKIDVVAYRTHRYLPFPAKAADGEPGHFVTREVGRHSAEGDRVPFQVELVEGVADTVEHVHEFVALVDCHRTHFREVFRSACSVGTEGAREFEFGGCSSWRYLRYETRKGKDTTYHQPMCCAPCASQHLPIPSVP